jgi:MFS family permease
MIGMGFVKSWDQLAGLRVILGFFEAGLFPGSVYLLSTWYTRCEFYPTATYAATRPTCPNQDAKPLLTFVVPTDEVGKRYSIFYLVGCVASAFAGILAFGVSCQPTA